MPGVWNVRVQSCPWNTLAGDVSHCTLFSSHPKHPIPRTGTPPKARTSHLVSTYCGPDSWHVPFHSILRSVYSSYTLPQSRNLRPKDPAADKQRSWGSNPGNGALEPLHTESPKVRRGSQGSRGKATRHTAGWQRAQVYGGQDPEGPPLSGFLLSGSPSPGRPRRPFGDTALCPRLLSLPHRY